MPRYHFTDAKGVFEDAHFAAALAVDVDGQLKMDEHFNGRNPSGSGSAARLKRRVDKHWDRRMSAVQRAPYEAKALARREHVSSYQASTVEKAAVSLPLLRVLLARCTQVHTLDLMPALYGNASRHVRLRSNDGVLQLLCTNWGASLRFARLGYASLSAEDIHALLAACPQLAHLQLRYVSLATGSLKTIFGDAMPRHPALRSVGLPPVSKSLPDLVERLVSGRFPALCEIDANSFDATRQGDDGIDVVARVARRAASRGVRRFLCESFFAGGGSDGEWGSDGGSVGEYIGDGNVFKYVR